jgi:hypothetical protein
MTGDIMKPTRMTPGERRTAALAAFGTFALCAAALLVVERVRAAGVPQTGFTYSGLLEDSDGVPVSGSVNVGVSLHDADPDGEKVCEADSRELVIVAGRFQISLPDECTAAVKVNPNLWLEVEVDGASLGRTQLGAVPYAVEANHAVTAETAEKLSIPPSAFRAEISGSQTVESGEHTPLEFEETSDANDEFADSTFTPTASGYYYINCNVAFDVSGVSAGEFYAVLRKNGDFMSHGGDVPQSTGAATTTAIASGVFELETGDEITCGGWQNSGASHNVYAVGSFTSFSGGRL